MQHTRNDLRWDLHLSWAAVDGAAGHQVLFGGDTTTMPNVGSEDCLVLGRVTDPEITGLELPPGVACRFYVRSAGNSGRLSFLSSTVEIAIPATPAGDSIEDSLPNKAMDAFSCELQRIRCRDRPSISVAAAHYFGLLAHLSTGQTKLGIRACLKSLIPMRIGVQKTAELAVTRAHILPPAVPRLESLLYLPNQCRA